MATAMQVILLEHVDNLGAMGETVRVKPGYARNFLLPQGKALRATKDNIAYFETQKAGLEKLNAEKRADAEKTAKKLDGAKVVLIRHASENGQLYGSVNARDIADAVVEATKQQVARNQVIMNTPLKTLGLFPMTLALHPEVKVTVTINIARTEEEAKAQETSGKAVVNAGRDADEAGADAKAQFLEDSALEQEREWSEEEKAEQEAKAAKAGKKAEKKAAKQKDDVEGEDA